MPASPLAELDQLMSVPAAATKLSALIAKAAKCIACSFDGQHILVVTCSDVHTCPEAAIDNRSKMLRQGRLCFGCMRKHTD